MVREHLTDGPYDFGGILIGDKVISMFNGAVIDLNDKSVKREIIGDFPWWVDLTHNIYVERVLKNKNR